MQNLLKNNWAIIATIIGLLLNSASAYIAVQISISKMDTRITAIEQRQDRQGDTIRLLQDQNVNFQTSLARLETSVSNLEDDMDYIRNKLDRVFP